MSNEAKLLTMILKSSLNPGLPANVNGIVDEVNKKVTFSLPAFTNVTNLRTSFTVSPGATAKVGALIQTNEVTANNFSTPVTYIITAQDGTQVSYLVTRHRDGYPHSSCCAGGANNCDSKYDLAALSPYGMHVWWLTSVLNRYFDFGFDCMPALFKQKVIDNTWNSLNNQRNNFCTPYTTPAKPSYWNDCKYK